MNERDRDASLLFGVFAVQLKKVTPQQLHEVAAAWSENPTHELSQMLVDAGYLTEQDRESIKARVVDAHHVSGGDFSAALETYGGRGMIEKTLKGSAQDIQDRLATVPMPEGAIPGVPIGVIDAVTESPGRYTNPSEYARGGIGRVLLVRDQHLGREIAMKELLPFTAMADSSMKLENESPVQQSMSLITRFLQEARVTGQLEHPSIVPVYELGRRRDGTLYYTMKLVRGRTMSAAISEAKTLSDRLALIPHFLNLCQAIGYSHSRRVIHRDIKPSNVMLGQFGETVVLDWGLAKVRDKKDEHAATMEETLRSLRLPQAGKPLETRAGQVFGTPTFMPPEQAAGQIDRVDERSDVYSLGAVLYMLLTGKYPYDGDTAGDVVNKVLVGPPTPAQTIEPNAPRELTAICERAMARDASKRYADAKELADDVLRFQTGALVLAYEYRFSEHLRRFLQRHKAVLGAAALFAVAFTAFAIYSYIKVVHERGLAITARDHEQEQRVIATQARDAEREQRKKAEVLLYQSNIRLAQSQIEAKRFDFAIAALDAAPPEYRGWEWEHLHDICHQDVLTFTGHKRAVSRIELSPDGTQWASGDDGGNVLLVSAATGEIVHSFPALDGLIVDLRFDASGSRVLAATPGGNLEMPDGGVTVWDVNTGESLVTFTAEGGGTLIQSEFSPDGNFIATTAELAGVYLWNANDGTLVHTFSLPKENVKNLSFHPNLPQIAAATSAGIVKVWDLNQRTEIASLDSSIGSVTGLKYSPDGSWLAVIGESGELTVWNTTYQSEPLKLKLGDEPVRCVAFSADGSAIGAGLDDGSAHIVQPQTGHTATLSKHDGGVLDIQWGATNSQVATVSADQSVRLWDTITGQQLRKFDGHSAAVVRLRFALDGSRLYSCSSDTTIKVWQVAPLPLAPVVLLQGHEGGIGGIAISPSGDRVVTFSNTDARHAVDVWDAGTGQLLTTIEKASAGVVYSATWSPDNGSIVVAYNNGTTSLWDVKSASELHVLAGHSRQVMNAIYSPDGSQILTVSRDNTAILWRASDGAQLHVFSGHSKPVENGVFSHDGKRVATNSYDKTIRVWDCETGNTFSVLQGHSAPINAVRFLSDGKRLVSAAGDNLVIIWDVDSGKAIRRLEGHTGIVFDLALSPDERRLASVSSDATMRIWDLESGQQITKSDGHSGETLSVSYSLDGRRIATSGLDQTVRMWDSITGLEFAVFHDHAGEVKKVSFSPDGKSIASSSESIAIIRCLL